MGGYASKNQKLVLIPDGIDEIKYVPASDKNMAKNKIGYTNNDWIILFTGRYVHGKNIHDLINGLMRIISSNENVYLLLVGQGNKNNDSKYEGQLKQMVNNMQLNKRIIFIKWQKEILPYLQAADIYVFPSKAEGLANSLLEAMSCGLAVVATKISGNEDVIVNGVNGNLYESGDMNKLAYLVENLIKNPQIIRTYGLKARETIENGYTRAMQMKRLESIIYE